MALFERVVRLRLQAKCGEQAAGLFPDGAVRPGASFDPVWNGEAIFHDVFEHWHEGIGFFKGPNALNLGGEMVASGALYYFQANLGVERFCGDNAGVVAETAVFRNTRDLLIEAWTHGMKACRPPSICPKYGLILRSGVPPQHPTPPSSNLEGVLAAYWSGVEDHAKTVSLHAVPRSAQVFRDSVTSARVNDLHRWGWHEASRSVPSVDGNGDRLTAFIRFWNRFCTTYAAEDLVNKYCAVSFHIYHDNGPVTIDATFEANDGSTKPVSEWY